MIYDYLLNNYYGGEYDETSNKFTTRLVTEFDKSLKKMDIIPEIKGYRKL